MEWTVSQKIYYPLTIIWNVILVVSTLLFISQRHSPSIRYRSITLSVLMVISNSLVTTLYLGREPDVESFPCFLNLWISSIAIPLWLTSVAGRFMRLAFLYHFSQAKLMAGTGSARYVDKATLENGAISTYLVLDENWYAQHREKFTTKYIAKLIGACVAFQTVLTLIIQVFTIKFQITPKIATGGCLVGWEFIPVWLTSAFYVFLLCPLFITWIRGVNDAYGIRRELIADFTLGVLAFLLYIIFASFPQMKNIRLIFPAAHWSVVALVFSHIFSIVAPTIEALKGGPKTRKSTSLASFDSMVEDPRQFEVFKRFTLRDFSVENVLFYERVIQLKLKYQDLPYNPKGSLSTEVVYELTNIYNTFITTGSEFELNLEAATISRLKERFQKELRLDVFDQALMEVRNLMYRYTYPRFVKLSRKNLEETML
ncbi:regulator of G protein signaling superfamily [Basidiobolus meristosporus CBS 931.73]|uniref:Regulator of G protein signaling superfamily n=1 Tax=Basidiobolus meristosporus CBS 931.73 TaxID=1314790 RepID=A0A1Y1X771_9FUNG|nr:regulator of G protein signaling superfamily [Basidiobolus meristosporus CBS 931.73]|eukprot:ORX81184.1 regulator of G protein signaling superfamily [Basidiobolus meristosporus CBS 931.73]